MPTEYLGLPLGAKHKEARVWDGVEERFRKRLALWKRQYISKGGRLILIRSVLSNMPTYLLSLFRIPKKVKFRLEKIQRDFLWGGGSSERKIHLINWDSVCQSKEKGGLVFAISPTLIGLCLGNGAGDSRRKITPCGGASLI